MAWHVMVGCRTQYGMDIVQADRVDDVLRNCWTARSVFVGTEEECEEYYRQEMQQIRAEEAATTQPD